MPVDGVLQEASWEDVSSGMSDIDEWQSYASYAVNNGAAIESERSKLLNFKNAAVQFLEENEINVLY